MLQLPAWHRSFVESILGYSLTTANITRRLVPYVKELSTYLREYSSRGGEKAEPYLEKKQIRDAYFAYFSIVNMLKMYRPFEELDQTGIFDKPSVKVLDIGCGTGTSLLSLAGWLDEFGVDTNAIEYHATDNVMENIHYTDRIYKALEETGHFSLRGYKSFLFDISSHKQIMDKYDIIILMNVLNELPDIVRHSVYKRLKDILAEEGYLIFVEPALKDTSRAMLGLRDKMIEDGWTVYSPCFRQGNCPALTLKRDWCHAEDNWLRPPFIEEIDRQINLVKLSLKYSYLIMNAHNSTLGVTLHSSQGLLFRSVSETFKEKGRTRVFLCGENGRHEHLFNHRDKTSANKAIQKLSRYDIVEVADVKRRSRDMLIDKTTKITKVRL